MFFVILGDPEAVVVVFLDYGVCLAWYSVVRDAELQERTDFLAEFSDCHTCLNEPATLLVHKTLPYRRRCGWDIMLYCSLAAQAVSPLRNGVSIIPPYGNGHRTTVLAACAARLQG